MNRRSTLLFLSLALLASTLACATITNIIATEAPTFTPEPQPQEIPTDTETAVPVLEASCPVTLTEIMDAATAASETSSDAATDSETPIVIYEVTGDVLSNPYYYDSIPADLQDEQNDTDAHQEVWNYFTSLIPAGQRKIIAEYSIMTDGKDNSLAAVAQTYKDPALWILEVDIADSSDAANLTYTLIHESGHLLTLSPDQVPPSDAIFNNPDDNNIYLEEEALCPDYFPGEGCSNPDSYINAFHDQFWGAIYDEWQGINLIEDDDLYYEELDNFYYNYEDQFVTDYAVTSPEEDIAESWSFFVLSPRPAGDTIAEQKVLFFYGYPELAQLRNEILNRLCTVYP